MGFGKRRTGRKSYRGRSGLLVSAITLSSAAFVHAATPLFDHIIVVIEENHSNGQIIGDSVNAPYINSLATGGLSFTNMFAVTHPSQPNYLQLYSGSNQGVTTDATPTDFTPFASAANLGAEVRSAGYSFAGYSEDLPSTSITAESSIAGGYRRKHNPWVNWQNDSTPTVNQLPSSVNRSFSAFPTDFTNLPNVSFVVPNQYHDMHDNDPNDAYTAVGAGDAWLQNNLSSYAQWAKTHNSLLIVTWDEDARQEVNRIPTIFYGANLRNGTNSQTLTLHNVLRTVEDVYGTGHAGAAANVRSIGGIFTNAPTAFTYSFQRGVSGPNGLSVKDTYINQSAATTSYATAISAQVDPDTDNNSANGKTITQALVRFDNIFGLGAGQIRPGSKIGSAKLVVYTGTGASDISSDSMSLAMMKMTWDETATWSANFGGNGINFNNVEASSNVEFALIPNVNDNGATPAIFDVTASIETWLADPSQNFGWVITGLTTGQDGWTFLTSDNATTGLRPYLEITLVPEPSGLLILPAAAILARRRRRSANAG